jgi:capsular polysaccharide transport system permease protein
MIPSKHWQRIKQAKLTQRLGNGSKAFSTQAVEKLKGTTKLFRYVVIVPTALSILYFGVIASDVYISESRYVVRSPKVAPQGGLGSLLSTVGITSSDDESYVIVNYMTSMDGMKHVNQSINLKDLFTSNSIDIFSRFASFYWNESFERLLQYFQKHVEIGVDPVSGVSTLRVRSYTPQSAQDINQQLLEGSDSLVNRLNEQSRQDLIKFSSYEVDVAKANLEKADLELNNFRNQKKGDDISNFIPTFQKLELERQTAEKQLGSAIASLEQARVDAQRKRLFIEHIVKPTLPDYPLEPKRIQGIIATLLLSLISWGILKLLIAGVKEHHD